MNCWHINVQLKFFRVHCCLIFHCVNIYFTMCPFTADGHLGYFQLEAMMMSIHEHTSKCLW